MTESSRLSNKCRYGLRAIFELSLRQTSDPVKIQDIASAQAIPQRFLEIILAELKQGGFVESRRGNKGGYMLARSADDLTVGEVISFFQGDNRKGNNISNNSWNLRGDYVFSKLWKEVSDAITGVYSTTTFAEMVQEELSQSRVYVANYAI
ncbi:MAG: Rrf2 family transcriptional regulator [Phycisphaerae bacterium]|nr:Rrf2 family transcriptional regulator [Phycisphaerae bacterium]NIP55984.1 Rrf2 family transcriptional regulator [Phycisphaerae bacterium]NIS54549.1 Rrf2 family transcriptional regulator [Phycisphaerae bacterium]NIU12185.1 Rrf2 family transcriptional regulator [Phycisphaerae bacterium]NIU58252.1 Rrf2 family transcriptional regulator [Phycisphaerae bacterium]